MDSHNGVPIVEDDKTEGENTNIYCLQHRIEPMLAYALSLSFLLQIT